MLATLVNLAWRGRFKDYQRAIIWACVIIVVVGWLLRFVEIKSLVYARRPGRVIAGKLGYRRCNKISERTIKPLLSAIRS
jgi:hypothetical protein